MNFSPFGIGVPLSSALPVATQFSPAGKLTQNVTTANGQVVGVLQGGENGIHYIRPIDATFTGGGGQPGGQNPGAGQQQAQTLITLPITMPGAKPGDPQQTVQIQVVNPNPVPVSQASAQSPKYHISQIPIQAFGQGATVLTVAYNPNQDGIPILQSPYNNFNAQGCLGDVLNQAIRLDGQNGLPEGVTVVTAIQPQDIQLIQAEPDKSGKEGPPLALIKTELANKEDENQQQQQQQQAQDIATIAIPPQYLQNASAVQEYLQKMQNSTLPLGLQQFLKFNNTDIKREQMTEDGVIEGVLTQGDGEETLIMNDMDGKLEEEDVDDPDKSKKKKKYKKKPPKPKKPKPGQVHIATALDGTTLFCCPECHMAYPEKELLEQHLVGHKIERRFICDICGAGLKRKEHLERHKLGHNPERPFVCSICMKGFKRKEHLNLHLVIHSGEKTEICGECGKGFYRKDHLRKHARSHITRRAKEQAERAQQQTMGSVKDSNTVTIQVPTSQLQIPVQIQVPQHHIQVTANAEDENNQVSTVVLPSSNEVVSILPN